MGWGSIRDVSSGIRIKVGNVDAFRLFFTFIATEPSLFICSKCLIALICFSSGLITSACSSGIELLDAGSIIGPLVVCP